MHPPKIILVATDFSAAAAAALDCALLLAARFDAQVYLLHAYLLPILGFPDGVLLPDAEIATRIMTSAQTDLANAVARRKDCGIVIRPILKQADARDAVLEAATELSADLIVVGTHGRKGFVRALIGSVAESVVRSAAIPVMTVHAGSRTAGDVAGQA